jgi:hypothetical protein
MTMNKIMTVPFYGTEMYAFQLGGLIVVALKPIVEGMGLDWSAQYRRVQRDPILKDGIAMMAIPSGRGGLQEQVCLRLDLIHGWLFTIETGRIKDDLRERVLLYKRECYDVLFRHFSGDRAKLVREANENIIVNLQMVRETRHIWGARAAAQMWIERGLPKVPAMDEMFRQGDLFDWNNRQQAA